VCKVYLCGAFILQAVENMCSHKMAAVMYDQLCVLCHNHIKGSVKPFLGYPFIIIIYVNTNVI
jgi:hypothetical protein